VERLVVFRFANDTSGLPAKDANLSHIAGQFGRLPGCAVNHEAFVYIHRHRLK